jgi:hypothetical protein
MARERGPSSVDVASLPALFSKEPHMAKLTTTKKT